MGGAKRGIGFIQKNQNPIVRWIYSNLYENYQSEIAVQMLWKPKLENVQIYTIIIVPFTSMRACY